MHRKSSARKLPQLPTALFWGSGRCWVVVQRHFLELYGRILVHPCITCAMKMIHSKQLGPSCSAGANIKWHNHVGKLLAFSYKS